MEKNGILKKFSKSRISLTSEKKFDSKNANLIKKLVQNFFKPTIWTISCQWAKESKEIKLKDEKFFIPSDDSNKISEAHHLIHGVLVETIGKIGKRLNTLVLIFQKSIRILQVSSDKKEMEPYLH
ncbi:hypothetical protein BpHYR1_021244 [Brachionus plicatilis]|uniref:Uncharacterized protein n=1 Tax=Brachionus plicatilis TaxID=10195 RepID=A0A3M7T5D8_BRAPC|nr:hypothetical protein BpHYR1_021244 [Brachionus plicatilis]